MNVSAVSTVDDLLTVLCLGLVPHRLVMDLAMTSLDPDMGMLVRLDLDLDSVE